MKIFTNYRLTNANRYGVRKSPKLARFLGRVEKEDHVFFEQLMAEIEHVEQNL
jgi:hypothetical protein